MQLKETKNSNLSQQRFDFPEEEQRVLEFWHEIDAFRTSLQLSKGG
jgi:isoleucyl-tRNA synthetase